MRAIVLTIRPRQWTKNVLFVFPAILFDVKLLDLDSLARVVSVCILLIMVSGSIYIFNDLFDREQDRLHPVKRNRPIAAGTLPVPVAIMEGALLAFVALLFAFSLNRDVALLLIVYIVIQVFYTLHLKHIALLDVFAVSAGFVIRVLVGGAVINVPVSPWLLAFTGLLALFLVIGKRRQELVKLGAQAIHSRPSFQHYNLPLLDEMLRITTTTTLITYILYTIEVETMTKQGINFGLLTVPFILYGLMRYLYLLHVEEIDSSPDEVFLTDRPIQIAVSLAAIAYFIILYVV